MKSQPRSFVWLGLGILLCLWSCKETKPTPQLFFTEDIGINEGAMKLFRRLKVSPKRLIKELKTNCKKSAQIVFTKKTKLPNILQLRLNFSIVPLVHPQRISPPKPKASFLFRISVDVIGKKQQHQFQETEPFQLTKKEQLAIKNIRNVLLLTWQKAVRSFVVWSKLHFAPTKQLLLAATSQDRVKLRHAIYFLGQKKVKKATPILTKCLHRKEQGVVLACIGALAKLRVPNAAIALIRISKGKSLPFQRQVVSALGEIGGEQASSYLYTLSSAHPDKSMRQTAKEAYEEIKQREKKKRTAKQK